ncbi:hypothetical protein ACJMK2_026305 [Sinanodonta woodiana]
METSTLCFLVGLLFTPSISAESRQRLHYVVPDRNYSTAIHNVSSLSVGSISDQCLKCICLVESNCLPIGCRMDVSSLSCGYYQIKLPYWTDCGRPGTGWKECADDHSCATTCVINYTAKYRSKTSCPDTCESYARIHNGGPHGCMKSSTIPYWHKVQSKGCS